MDYRYRFLSSNLGKFIQPDPVTPNLTNSQAWNRYSYVNNSPINYVDPSGHLPESALSSEPCLDGWMCFDDPKSVDASSDPDTYLKIYAGRQLVEVERGRITDLDALVSIVETAAHVYDGDWDGMLPTLTDIFVGTSTTGPLTLLSAVRQDGCAGIGRSARDCPSNQYHFGDSGFHPDFRDYDNQLYHFWAYLVQTATPGNRPASYAGFLVGTFGNDFHEIGQSVLNKDGGWGTSWNDYVLSVKGMEIGIDITNGKISPYNLGNVISGSLGASGEGSQGMLEYLIQNFGPLKGMQ